MFDIVDNITRKLLQTCNQISKDGKRYFQSAISKVGEISSKGKVQIEIEKLNWELKQKYTILGKYVADNKKSKSVTDFSHDQEYLKQVNAIIQLRFYIEERKKSKETVKSTFSKNKA